MFPEALSFEKSGFSAVWKQIFPFGGEKAVLKSKKTDIIR
jgi:hypothetical protein